MAWVLAFLGLAFATQIWLCFRVGRSNVALAIATFFIGFPAALYTFFKHRGDPETSVTVPFIANVVFTLLFLGTAWKIVLPMLEAQETKYDLVSAPASRPDPSPSEAPAVGGTTLAVAAAPAASEAASDAGSSPAAAAASAVAAADSFDSFAAALNAAGLNHTVTRLSGGQQLPPGVVEAALFSITPRGTPAAAASAASAPAPAALSATLFRCASANACRQLAGLHMQLARETKPRVLQNGLLLLSLPAASGGDADLTPTAVASAFRKL